MSVLMGVAETLRRHAVWFMSLALVGGALAPDLAALIAPGVIPLVVTILALSIARMDIPAMAIHLRRPRLAALVIVWVLGVTPLVAYVICVPILGLPSPTVTAIVLNAATPPVVSVAALAFLFGFTPALALAVLLGAAALAPITLPLVTWLVPEVTVALGPLTLAWRLAAIVGSAVIIAAIIRFGVGGPRLARAATPLDGMTVILVTVLGIGLMDGVGPLVAERPGLALTMAIAAFAVNGGSQLVALAVFSKVEGPARGSILVVTGNRNMALILAAVLDVITVELRLQVIFAQVPIYALPLLLRPIYLHLAGRGGQR